MSRRKAIEETDKLTRIAIINTDKCKPKRCRQECKKSCPVVRMGKLCIEVTPNDKKASISEELCIGCGICVKVIYHRNMLYRLYIYHSIILEMSIRSNLHHQPSQQFGKGYDPSLWQECIQTTQITDPPPG